MKLERMSGEVARHGKRNTERDQSKRVGLTEVEKRGVVSRAWEWGKEGVVERGWLRGFLKTEALLSVCCEVRQCWVLSYSPQMLGGHQPEGTESLFLGSLSQKPEEGY